ncbi:MAG: hypothetical protein FWG67_08140 [Defluviitaleaceae bacterium]|nr:hypothetical protein [Defluviitaleaceae bacterium]
MIRISQLKLNIEASKDNLPKLIAKKLKIKLSDIKDYRIFKESIDARHETITFVYTVDATLSNEASILNKKIPHVAPTPQLTYKMPPKRDLPPTKRPVVIGFGPSGMYAALLLAQCGYHPIILERGGSVAERVKNIEDFCTKGILDPESNIQFGEGGAGTFSDGKLTTRVKDLRGRKVLEELVHAGAPEEILYEAHPHVGTDLLRDVVVNIRKTIIALGGEIHFNTRVDDFIVEDGQIRGVITHQNQTFHSEHVILAVGHSARDTFKKIYDQKIDIAAKPFAVGFRVEHPQALINKAQYKAFANHPKLGAAEYRLTHQASNGRGVYTFCMCPGGFVVPSASEPNKVVTNGMSEHARGEANANSAVLVQVQPSDFESDHPLAGIDFQRELESKAFVIGGENYKAPAQLIGDFLANRPSTSLGSVKPSYDIGIRLTNLRDLLPKAFCDAIAEGLQAFDKKLAGFSMDDALLTGVESRSSSPVRVTRDSESLQSTNLKGFYPAGEGAGFAGGIVSSAIDGLKCAEKLIAAFS